MAARATLLLLASLALLSPAAALEKKYGPLETLYEWKTLDFHYSTEEERQQAIANGAFVPVYCTLFDVKAVDGEVFVTIPRMRRGVPSSVNRVVKGVNGTGVLSPYPNWEINHPGDCKNIQNAYAIEIDPLRRMWILDTGSRDIFSRPVNECPAKIVVWDMVEDREVRRYVFDTKLVPTKRNKMLRGIVLDVSNSNPEDWFAYVSYTSADKLLVYSWREHEAWAVKHDTMKYDVSSISVSIPTLTSDTPIYPVAIDSLAISPITSAEQKLFFTPVSSFRLYSISTAFLQNRTRVLNASEAELDAEVQTVGARSSLSEAMTVSDSGIMFYSVLNNHAVNQWNISKPFSAKDQVYKDDERLQWTAAFGWDGGYLYVISNRWHAASNQFPDDPAQTEPMHRLMRARVDMDGYMGPYRRGKKMTGAAPPRAGVAAAALLCAVLVAVV